MPPWTKYLTGLQMGMALLEQFDAASADGVVTDEEIMAIIRQGLESYKAVTGRTVEIKLAPTSLASE